MTVAELITRHMAGNTKRSRREDARHAAWWIARVGARPLRSLSAEQLVTAKAELEAKPLAPQTVLHYLKFLRHLLNHAVRDRLIAVNPFVHVPTPRVHQSRLRVLTAEDEQRLLAAMDPDYAPWVRFALLTGLKRSEQFTLRWNTIDLARGHLWLTAHGGSGAQYIPLCPEAISILSGLHTSAQSVWVCPSQNPETALDQRNFMARVWTPAVRRSGIAWCVWDDLRETFAVRLVQHGIDPVTLSALLRYSHPSQTKRYFDRGPAAMKAAVWSLSQGDPLTRDQATLTIGDVIALYVSQHLVHKKSPTTQMRALKQFFPRWNDRPLRSLTRRELRVWQTELAQTPHQANRAIGLMRTLFRWAEKMDLYSGIDPTRGIQRFKTASRARFYTDGEIEAIRHALATTSSRFQALVLGILLTGSRIIEVRTMRWQDLDLTMGRWMKPTSKSGTSHLVPLPQQMVLALEALPQSSPWVFPGHTQGPIGQNTATKAWRAFRKKVGLKNAWLYDLRRTCASHLAIHGENLPVIQAALNHSTLQHTAIYARLNIQPVRRALQAQADRFFQSNPVTGARALTHQPARPKEA